MTFSSLEDPTWAIESIPANEAGFAFYLSEYKPFRLTALREDPNAFGSNYEREITFADEYWYGRLHKPLAKTFIAVRLRDRRILATTTVFGPMPSQEVMSNPAIAAAATADVTVISSTSASVERESNDTGNDGPLLYQFTGVYTRAEVRRQGLGQALSKVAAEYAHADARRRGGRCRLALDVYTTNTAAIAFYQKCGFVVGEPRPVDEDTDDARPEVVMYYRDTASGNEKNDKDAG